MFAAIKPYGKATTLKKGLNSVRVVITSPEWNSTAGVFQVYALEGTGNGIADGKFSVSPGVCCFI